MPVKGFVQEKVLHGTGPEIFDLGINDRGHALGHYSKKYYKEGTFAIIDIWERESSAKPLKPAKGLILLSADENTAAGTRCKNVLRAFSRGSDSYLSKAGREITKLDWKINMKPDDRDVRRLLFEGKTTYPLNGTYGCSNNGERYRQTTEPLTNEE
jgi:hypothetical protein